MKPVQLTFFLYCTACVGAMLSALGVPVFGLLIHGTVLVVILYGLLVGQPLRIGQLNSAEAFRRVTDSALLRANTLSSVAIATAFAVAIAVDFSTWLDIISRVHAAITITAALVLAWLAPRAMCSTEQSSE